MSFSSAFSSASSTSTGMATYDALVVEKSHTSEPGLSFISIWKYREDWPVEWDGDFSLSED